MGKSSAHAELKNIELRDWENICRRSSKYLRWCLSKLIRCEALDWCFESANEILIFLERSLCTFSDIEVSWEMSLQTFSRIATRERKDKKISRRRRLLSQLIKHFKPFEIWANINYAIFVDFIKQHAQFSERGRIESTKVKLKNYAEMHLEGRRNVERV